MAQRPPVDLAYARGLFANGAQRRAAARREIIALQVKLSTLLEPKNAGDPVTETWPDGTQHTYIPWTERQAIQQRIGELYQVANEPI